MTAISFHRKIILAPMVRTGTLPMRLLALKYGADIVYTPEIVDKRLVEARRVETSQTVNFQDKNDIVFLRIHKMEKPNLVLQLGSSDPLLALEAAKMVENDVSAVDLNCGCPKSFSLSGGMGAALLERPDLLVEILETLVSNLKIPVTCKIRILPDPIKTLELAKRIEATGIQALIVHARTRTQTYDTRADWDIIQLISQSLSIPVIANGDIFTVADIKALESRGIQSFMSARAAQLNVSSFQSLSNYLKGKKEVELVPIYDIMKEYFELSLKLGMPSQNCKYVLLQMCPLKRSPLFKPLSLKFEVDNAFEAIARSKSSQDLSRLFKIEETDASTNPLYDFG